MAANSNGFIRVRLFFDYPPPAASDCRMCWLLVDLNACRVVADLESIIREKFDFSSRSILNLFIDDCYLPHTERILVVRDNDSVRVKVDTAARVNGHSSCPDTASRNCRKRQRPTEDDGPVGNGVSEERKEKKRKKKSKEGLEAVAKQASGDESKKSQGKHKEKKKKKKQQRPPSLPPLAEPIHVERVTTVNRTVTNHLLLLRPSRGVSSRTMADDLDIEAMLEAPYRKDDTKAQSPNGQDDRTKRKKRSRSRNRKRSKSREKKRSRSRERKRSRSRDRKKSRSRERRHSRERGGRYRDHHKKGRRSRSKSPLRKDKSPLRKDKSPFKKDKSPFRKDKSPIRQPIDNLTPEERDARTVFCMQLAARIRPRDLEDFFSAVGKVRDVRMISDRNSRRSKGIAYIEFTEATSVPLAIGLTGQRLLGVPIIVQASQAEKNRAAAAAAAANNLQKGTSGPMRLYVGSLHFNITEEMLRGIFEPFGRIESIQLMMDSENGRSKGYGFITFADAECAKKALDQLNGFELAGRPMKVGNVTERTDGSSASSFLDNDELERTGIDLGTTGRLQLMARLAEGTGLQIPPAAQQALQMSGAIALGAMAAVSAAMNPVLNMNMSSGMDFPPQPLATQCFQLANMFQAHSVEAPGWDVDIQHDVIEECNKHGGVVYVYVDKNSEGNVYVKCPSIPAAMAAVNALHGRYFAGKMITAAFVPLSTYHNLFPESVNATQLLAPRR